MQILHQVADGEIGGIALAVVAIFLAGLKRLHVGRRDGFGQVAETFERTVHQLFVFPGEPAEQQRGVAALLGREGPLDRLLELMNLALDDARFSFQPGALFRKPLLDHVFDGFSICTRPAGGVAFGSNG